MIWDYIFIIDYCSSKAKYAIHMTFSERKRKKIRNI